MPRKKQDDLDFEIYVDPSCLSDPMEEDTAAPQPSTNNEVPSIDETLDRQLDVEPETDIPAAADAADTSEISPAEDVVKETDASPLEEDVQAPNEDIVESEAVAEPETDPEADLEVPAAEESEDIPSEEPTGDDAADTEIADDSVQAPSSEEQVEPEVSLLQEEDSQQQEAPPEEQPAILATEDEPAPQNEPEQEDYIQEEDISLLPEDVDDEDRANPVQEESALEPEQNAEEPLADEEPQTEHDFTPEPAEEPSPEQVDDILDRETEEHIQEETTDDAMPGDDEDTPRPAERFIDVENSETRPSSPAATFTERKTSLRTEALIQAAARAVVSKIEKRKSNHDENGEEEDEADLSILSSGTQERHEQEDVHSSYDDQRTISRQSTGSPALQQNPSHSTSGDEGGDSSSHNEDDMFSDRSARSSQHSARSSVASFDDHDLSKTPQANHDNVTDRRDSYQSRGRSPRVSGISTISGFSQYEKEEFLPTPREARMPFRSPDAVRAMQMSSPTPSVFNGSSPRSGKRHAGLPTISRVGSPTVSAQYSPKGRSTPPRLKARKEAPLVLLHVTLLPLRWMWGDVMNGLDAVNGKHCDENGQIFEASEQLKTLRDSWRMLQDRIGDTVLERGILLPHPQNDYEVLEERLLEALELPLRRRARILQCGHYLGPSNETVEEEEEDSEDEYASQPDWRKEDKKHWCNSCQHEIKYEDLGPGKVFRVKVYASNGLMKAGAWEACWKEMERVDIEVEPIVDTPLQHELERLVAVQYRQEEEQLREAEAGAGALPSPQQVQETQADIQNRRQSNDTPVHGQEIALPTASYADLQEQHRSAMSSPTPAGMQLTMHASPVESPSPAMRPDSAAMMHNSLSARPPSSEPVDHSAERRRRDEERHREIYGDSPMPLERQLIAPMHAPSPIPQQHQGSYTPTPGSRPHGEESYERREQQESIRRAYENASFVDLLCEAFKVLLRDPKNVAIIVLCLFFVVMLIRPSQSVPSFEKELSQRYTAQPEVVINTTPAQIESLSTKDIQVIVSTVVPEASTSTVIEELVMYTPSADIPVSAQELESSAAPQESLVSTSIMFDMLMSALQVIAESPTNQVADEPLATVVAETVESADAIEAPLPTDVPGALQADDVTEEISDDSLQDADKESAPDVEEEASEQMAEDSSRNVEEDNDSMESPLPEVSESDDVEDIEPRSESEVPTSSVEEEAMKTPSVEPEALAEVQGGAVSTEEPEIPECVAAPEPSSSAVEDEEANYPECALPEASVSTEPESSAEDDMAACEPYEEEPTSSSAAYPPLVTEKKTIRVVETITETVQVSVTETSTVSSVETAVPQTVEETVYETETVRVTVSVPLDSVSTATAEAMPSASASTAASAQDKQQPRCRMH